MHGFRNNEVLLQAGYDIIVILRQGALYAIFGLLILIGRSIFYISVVLYCNYTSIMHRFRFSELYRFAGNDVIAISSLGGASDNF